MRVQLALGTWPSVAVVQLMDVRQHFRMNTPLFTLALLFSSLSSVIMAADAPEAGVVADSSVCVLHYGGYGECISELAASQVLASPVWDVSAGAPPLLPTKAESIAKKEIEKLVAPYAHRAEPLLFSYWKTRLIELDETHWFYSIQFTQHPAGGSTGVWPTIEVFVSFDGNVGSLKLTSPPTE